VVVTGGWAERWGRSIGDGGRGQGLGAGLEGGVMRRKHEELLGPGTGSPADDSSVNAGLPGGRTREHPLVVAARRALVKADTDTHGMLVDWSVPHLEMSVAPGSLERALAFWGSVIDACAREGFIVKVEGERPTKTVIVVEGERLLPRLREKYHQVPFKPTPEEVRKEKGHSPFWPRVRYLPSGVFEFTVQGADCAWDLLRHRDAKRKIDASYEWVGPSFKSAATRNREAREERQRQEVVSRKAAEERWEVQRRRAEEEGRRKDLFVEVGRWQQSQALREYLRAVREKEGDGLVPGSELEKWLGWAEKVANENDPLKDSESRDV
jgi:hypothetical protein